MESEEEDLTLEDVDETLDDNTKEDSTEKAESMFMTLGCGMSEAFTAVANACHFGTKEDVENEKDLAVADLELSMSAHSSSHLTDLEKRAWNEWDKLASPTSKSNKTSSKSKTLETVEEKKKTPKKVQKKNVDHEKKRENAQGRLLEIASSAISSEMSNKEEAGVPETANSGYVTESTGESSSGSVTTESANSGANTGSVSESATEGHTDSTGSSRGSKSTDEDTNTYFSGSEVMSELMSVHTRNAPILLSFSQRNLIERFVKQLSHVSVEVLKLNRRNVYQPRYFTVSTEKVALVSHEAKQKSGADVAQCPKALLWVKKFNAKNGNYSQSNIDKNGHGGMLLVNLVDIRVEKKPAESSFPRKLARKYKDSVVLTLLYLFQGEDRCIEFRCKDNDEAQFLCTCMRVIRDLLKREQTLRLNIKRKTS